MGMLLASIADLAGALDSDGLAALHPRLRRALEIDRRVWTQYPDSLASCLLARTFGDPAVAELHAAWMKELEASGRPWIRPLRALPVAEGLVAELHAGAGLSFAGLHVPRFTSEGEVIVVARRLHPTVQAPELRRRERLRWGWAGGEAVIEPDPEADAPPLRERFPRIVTDGWGPAYLVRSPGATRVVLPCPEEGSADAKFTPDGARLIVYGTLDEYAGGFVWVVDPETLAVERALDVGSPVASVEVCDVDRMLVSTYRSGTIAWIDRRSQVLPPLAGELCLSPDGAHVASFGEGLQIWSLAALLQRGGEAPRAGFPARFDPDGERLICGRALLEGRSGRPLAELAVELGSYLEGGPAQPWLYFGTRALVCSHGGFQVWDTPSGAPRRMQRRLGFPHWYALAYDRTGLRLAVLHQGESRVALHELPKGRVVREIEFEIAGSAVAMSPDGELVAIQGGGAVEVRTAAGALVRRLDGPAPDEGSHRRYGDETLRFSAEGRRVARLVEGEGWRIGSLDDAEEVRVDGREGIAEVDGFAEPRPSDWAVEVNTLTVFTHRPSGARIALPVAGRWVHNPADPRIAACDAMIVALCGG